LIVRSPKEGPAVRTIYSRHLSEQLPVQIGERNRLYLLLHTVA